MRFKITAVRRANVCRKHRVKSFARRSKGSRSSTAKSSTGSRNSPVVRLATIHIVGGGTNNKLLSQLTADATNRRVIAGPVEATAIGNLLMQYIALGEIASIRDAREIVRASFPVEEFTPRGGGQWDEAFAKFVGLPG